MNTSPKVIFIVVIALALYVPFGGYGVYQLIVMKADPALIAVVSGLVGTALGGLMSMLNNTRSQATEPTSVRVTNTTANPVPTDAQ